MRDSSEVLKNRVRVSDNSLLGHEHNKTEVRVGRTMRSLALRGAVQANGRQPNVLFGQQIDNVEKPFYHTTFSINVHNQCLMGRLTIRVLKSTRIYVRFGTNELTGPWGYAALFFALYLLYFCIINTCSLYVRRASFDRIVLAFYLQSSVVVKYHLLR